MYNSQWLDWNNFYNINLVGYSS